MHKMKCVNTFLLKKYEVLHTFFLQNVSVSAYNNVLLNNDMASWPRYIVHSSTYMYHNTRLSLKWK